MNSFKKQTQGDALFFPSSPNDSYGDATVPHKRAPTIKDNDETTIDEDDDLIILDEYYIPLTERVKKFRYAELGPDYNEEELETFVRSKRSTPSKRSHSQSRDSTPAKRCRTVSPAPSVTPIDPKELETIPKARSHAVKKEPDNLRLVGDSHKGEEKIEDRVERVQPKVQREPEHKVDNVQHKVQSEQEHKVENTQHTKDLEAKQKSPTQQKAEQKVENTQHTKELEAKQKSPTQQKAEQKVQGEVKVPILKNVPKIPISHFRQDAEPVIESQQNDPVTEQPKAPVKQTRVPAENPAQQAVASLQTKPAKGSSEKENSSLIPDELRRVPLKKSQPTKISVSTLKEMSSSFSKPAQSLSKSPVSLVGPSRVEPSASPSTNPSANPATDVSPVTPASVVKPTVIKPSAVSTPAPPTPSPAVTPAAPPGTSNKAPTLISNNQNIPPSESVRKVFTFDTMLKKISQNLKTDRQQLQKDPLRYLISSNCKKDDFLSKVSQILSSFEEPRFNAEKEFRWCALNELKRNANQAFWQLASKKSGIFWIINKWLRSDMKSKNPKNIKEIVEILHICAFPTAVLVSYKLDKPLNLLYGKLQKSQDPKDLELASLVKKVLNPYVAPSSVAAAPVSSKQPADIFKTMNKQPAQVSKSSIYVAPTKKSASISPPAVSAATSSAASAPPGQEQKKSWSFADYRNAAKRKKSTETAQSVPQEEKKAAVFLDEHQRAKTEDGLLSLLRKSSDKDEIRKPRKLAQKGVQWKPHAELTLVREFFSDPNERVSMPMADLPQEGSALRNRAMEDDEQPPPVESQGDISWKDPMGFDFSQIPWFSEADAQFNVESKGGEERIASVEKLTQQQRCNSVGPADSTLCEKLQPSMDIIEKTAWIPSFGNAGNGART